jgi:hypothetical protein
MISFHTLAVLLANTIAGSSVVPYQVDENGIFVMGSVGNFSTASDDLTPLYLVFTTVTMIVYESLDYDHSCVSAGQGRVLFQTANDTLIDGFYDERISIMRSGTIGTIHLITLGVGPNSPLQSQHGSVVFLPFSNRNGSMLLGILEDEFASFCDTGTNFRVPFASPETGSRIYSQFRGRFFLINRFTNERIAPTSTTTADRIGIVREYIYVPENLYEHISELIPALLPNERFGNCERIRGILPIIGLDLYAEYSNISGTLLFYPEDYTTETEEPDTCLLKVWRAPSVIGEGFDPFLLRQVNFRISNTHTTFCDAAVI